jgi:hypothetical protein
VKKKERAEDELYSGVYGQLSRILCGNPQLQRRQVQSEGVDAGMDLMGRTYEVLYGEGHGDLE